MTTHSSPGDNASTHNSESRAVLHTIRQLLPTPRSAPVTFVLLCVVIVAAVLVRIPDLQSPVHEYLTFTWGQFSEGRVWTPWTALLIPGRMAGLLLQILLLCFVIPLMERRFGGLRLASVFFGIGGISHILGGGAITLLATAGEPWAKNAESLLVGDPSVGLIAVVACFLAASSPVWRHRGFVIVGIYVAVVFAYSGQPSDISRAIAFVGGWFVGARIFRKNHANHQPVHRYFPAGHEVRVIGATIVAILACGPIVSVLSRASLGLMSPSLVLVDSDVQPVAEAPCSVYGFGQACGDWLVWGLQTHQRTTAWIQLLPVIVLLVAAYGILRGRRSAMWIATLMLVRNALGVGLVFFATGHRQALQFPASAQHLELAFQVVVVIAVNGAMAYWLIRNRRSFEIRLSRRGAVLGWSVAGGTILASAAATTAIALLMRHVISPAPELAHAIRAGFALSLPPSARFRLGATVHAVSWEARLPFYAIEIAMWVILIILTWRVVTSGLWGYGPSSGQVRERLRIGGGTHISFMATWPGNLLWQDPVTGAIVAYRAVAGIALTLSQPFGAPHVELMGIVTRFHQFADTRGLTPVWYSVDDEQFAPIASTLGWQSIEVAQESVVNVQEWRTVGKAWQDVRSAISRAKRESITAGWTSWRDMTVGAYTQIVELSQEWVSDHPLPEMGFTLGGLEQLHDRDVRLMVATNEDGRVEGVLSWLPTWRDGVVVGWTLDFMRRRSDSMPGLIEFLIASSAMHMKDEGVEFMSLSGAPLAGESTEGDSSQLDMLLTFVSETLEPVYGFQSLHRFKQKFQPEVHSWTMVFPSAMDLPAIGIAVTRSYLPHLSLVDAVKAMRELAGTGAGAK